MTIHAKRIGVRAVGMFFAAYIWILLGVGAFREVPVTRLGAFHLSIPPEVRGSFWIATAVIAVLCAALRPTIHWPGLAFFIRGKRIGLPAGVYRRCDLSSLGIGALFLMPGLHMISYAFSWALYEIPGGSAGFPNGWYSSAIYLGLVFWVVFIGLVPSLPAVQASMGADE